MAYQNRPHFGKGLKFPINGKFESESGVDKILEDIQLLILTKPGERVMRPEYGCVLPTRIWENMDSVAQDGIGDIVSSIQRFEPRVSLIEILPSIDRSRGLIIFQIRMIILETNQEANLVFPFKSASDISQQ